MSGIYTGVLDVYVALMTANETGTTAATYGTPEVLGHSIEVTLSPNYKEGNLYASNTRIRDIKNIDYFDVTVNVDNIDSAMRQKVLGRTMDANHVEKVTGSQVAPYVAIGFAVTKDDGNKTLYWLVKGKFSEFEVSASTETDSIDYKTPSLSATFVRRLNDDVCYYVCDTENLTEGSTVATNWFSAVYA